MPPINTDNVILPKLLEIPYALYVEERSHKSTQLLLTALLDSPVVK